MLLPFNSSFWIRSHLDASSMRPSDWEFCLLRKLLGEILRCIVLDEYSGSLMLYLHEAITGSANILLFGKSAVAWKNTLLDVFILNRALKAFWFLVTLPYCLPWYISWVPSLKTVDSCAKLQSNVSKKTSADNTSVAWCYATWWNAESFLNISWGGNGMARRIFSNYILDMTLLRGQSSNPPSTKSKEGSEEKSSRFFHWFSRCYWVCPACSLISPVPSGIALLRLQKERKKELQFSHVYSSYVHAANPSLIGLTLDFSSKFTFVLPKTWFSDIIHLIHSAML